MMYDVNGDQLLRFQQRFANKCQIYRTKNEIMVNINSHHFKSKMYPALHHIFIGEHKLFYFPQYDFQIS